jgi:hypothetical protein
MATKKVVKRDDYKRPVYLNEDGTLAVDKIFKHQPKQTELLEFRTVNGNPYLRTLAPQCLSVGGIRSGKTVGVLMYFIMNYTLAYDCCDILVLRRTFKELESGAIADFKTFVPPELYTYDQTKHVATFVNGSRVVFGHCQNNKMRDIEQYLGQAYPAILVDEAGQFSPDAWMMLYSRNTVNAACKEDKYGNMPLPVIWGCTNPLGPYYEYYRTVFVQKEPFEKPEGARRDDTNGTWWVQEAGNWHCIYDPTLYACQRSTVMDNPELLRRDPGIIARLNSMPKAKRDKLLLGLDGSVEGQYFDCFDPFEHVIDLREDPEAIIWQHWQPVWGSQDWSMGGHHNAAYLFTRAMVRTMGTDYKLKTVCFRETVMQGGKTHKEWAVLFKNMCKRIGGMDDRRSDWMDDDHKYIKPKAIYFSHEKFSKQVTAHSPADEISKEYREVGLPPVSRANPDRVGGASMMYNMLKNGQLVILDNCKDIILSFPSLMRDPDNMDDVLKVDTRGDDCYDAFRYGIYGMYSARKKPEEDNVGDYGRQLAKTDPVAAHFYLLKMANEAANRNAVFVQKEQPVWMGKCM